MGYFITARISPWQLKCLAEPTQGTRTSHLAVRPASPRSSGAPGLNQCRKEREEEQGGFSGRGDQSVLGGGWPPGHVALRLRSWPWRCPQGHRAGWEPGSPASGEQHPLSLWTGVSVWNALLCRSCVKLPRMKAGFPPSVQLDAQVCKAKENRRGHGSCSNNPEHQVRLRSEVPALRSFGAAIHNGSVGM